MKNFSLKRVLRLTAKIALAVMVILLVAAITPLVFLPKRTSRKPHYERAFKSNSIKT